MIFKNGKSPKEHNHNLPNVDPEWLRLLLDARAIGLSIEDIKSFLNATRNLNSENDNHT